MGSGVAQVPHGADGRRLLNYMDSCLEAGRGFLSRNMAGRRSARNRVVDTEHGYVIIATADGTGC